MLHRRIIRFLPYIVLVAVNVWILSNLKSIRDSKVFDSASNYVKSASSVVSEASGLVPPPPPAEVAAMRLPVKQAEPTLDDIILKMRISQDRLDFEDFNNKNLTDDAPMIIPNLVHLIYLTRTELRFHDMVCIYSLYLNSKPDAIMIHCENCSLHGEYWDKVNAVEGIRKIIKMNKIPYKRGIFGKLSNHPRYAMSHRGDYWFVATFNLQHFFNA